MQVGQVILSLPHSLWQTGMVAGIVMMLGFASLAMWTVYLMVVLYLDHKNRKIKEGTWYVVLMSNVCMNSRIRSILTSCSFCFVRYTEKENTRKTANQYHEVMQDATYRWLGIFSRIVVIIALGGLAVAQIIASSSNFYRLVPSVNKRYVCWILQF